MYHFSSKPNDVIFVRVEIDAENGDVSAKESGLQTTQVGFCDQFDVFLR